MSYPLPILRIILLGLLVSLTLGWSGLAQAETCFGLPDTDPNVCSGVGSCVGPDICACDVGYVGSECELSAVPATSPLGLALIMGLLTMASAVAIRHSLRTL